MVIYNDISGLAGDCINTWSPLGIIHDRFHEFGTITREEFGKLLREPIRRYLQYVREQNPQRVEEAEQTAKPGFIEAFDFVVDKYNALSLEEKMKQNAFAPYRERDKSIVKGQIPK